MCYFQEDSKDPVKPWERPWNTDEMRQQSASWNLAGDSGLLRHLQQFSQVGNLLMKGVKKKIRPCINPLKLERFEVLVVMTLEKAAFWEFAPSSLIDRYSLMFWKSLLLPLLGSKWCDIPADSHLHSIEICIMFQICVSLWLTFCVNDLNINLIAGM